jgi:hypothetical protein
MADETVLIVERDVLGRPGRVERYGPGEPLPEWARQAVKRETQVQDPRDEVKHAGGPWYELPDGEKVRGKDAVREAGFEI